jgi:hypothetical protein
MSTDPAAAPFGVRLPCRPLPVFGSAARAAQEREAAVRAKTALQTEPSDALMRFMAVPEAIRRYSVPEVADLLGRPEEELAELGPTLYGRRHGRHFRVACCAANLRAHEDGRAQDHDQDCEHGRRRMLELVNERISDSRPWEHQRNGALMEQSTTSIPGNTRQDADSSKVVPDYGARSNGDTTVHVGPTAAQTDDLVAAFAAQHAAARARVRTTTRARPTIPARLRIGHLAYTVTVSDAEVDKTSNEEKTTLSGFSEHHRQRIVLREDNVPDYQAETLLHEILHQCLRVCGVNPDSDAKAGVADVEERTVSSMSGPLLAALRDNPDLVAYLTAGTD